MLHWREKKLVDLGTHFCVYFNKRSPFQKSNKVWVHQQQFQLTLRNMIDVFFGESEVNKKIVLRTKEGGHKRERERETS